ncbi:hypothetical protein HDU67_000442 [Dinochytrium kinnereticum]|nr:hypothetical protein HDU67_000442 [Dinochytrium kinnereticum]
MASQLNTSCEGQALSKPKAFIRLLPSMLSCTEARVFQEKRLDRALGCASASNHGASRVLQAKTKKKTRAQQAEAVSAVPPSPIHPPPQPDSVEEPEEQAPPSFHVEEEPYDEEISAVEEEVAVHREASARDDEENELKVVEEEAPIASAVPIDIRKKKEVEKEERRHTSALSKKTAPPSAHPAAPIPVPSPSLTNTGEGRPSVPASFLVKQGGSARSASLGMRHRKEETEDEDPFESPELSYESKPYAPQMIGVRAEARPIKAPSTLQNITSFVSGISSFVAHNLPERFTSAQSQTGDQHILLEDELEEKPPEETILSCQFAWVDWDLTAFSRRDPRRTSRGPQGQSGPSRYLCLLLGYDKGFQIWNVSDVDNIREVLSVREGIGRVEHIENIPTLSTPLYASKLTAELADAQPLIALGTSIPQEDTSDENLGALIVYSLKLLKPLRRFTYAPYNVTSIRCSERIMVVALSSNQLQLYSLFTLLPLITMTDISPSPTTDTPVFCIGTRYLIYASSIAPPATRRKHSGQSFDTDGGDDVDYETTTETLGAVAGKVAKEFVGGVKVLGGLGYQALSSYFQTPATGTTGQASGQGAGAGAGPRRTSVSKDAKDKKAANKPKRSEIEGVIIVRDIHPSLLTSETPVHELPVLAHWKPHTNPISIIALSPSETLFVTASTIANNFYVWCIPPGPPRDASNPRSSRCLYKLERGFTAASVEDVAFSRDGKWIGVSTGRGTTHLYEIDENPLGISIKPTPAILELGALNGLLDGRPGNVAVLNPASVPPDAPLAPLIQPHSVVSLYPTARIKQHLPMGRGGKDPDVNGPGGPHTDPLLEEIGESNAKRSKLIVAFLNERYLTPSSSKGKPSSAPASANPAALGSSPGVGAGGPLSWGARNSPGGAIGAGSLNPQAGLTGQAPSKLRRQKILTLHPSGTLMLHYVDMTLIDASTGLTPGFQANTGLAVGSPGRKTVSSLSPGAGNGTVGGFAGGHSAGFSPSSFLSATMQQLGSANISGSSAAAAGAAASGTRVAVQEVLEWSLLRDHRWQEMLHSVSVRPYVPPPKDAWLTHIETLTYDPLAFGPPLWRDSRFKFFRFVEDGEEQNGESSTPKGKGKKKKEPRPEGPVFDPDRRPAFIGLPDYVPVEIQMETPKPYGLDVTKIKALYPAVGDENVSDDLSSAMVDGLDFSKATMSVPLRQREGLSFEDAYVIDESIPADESMTRSSGSNSKGKGIWKKLFEGGGEGSQHHPSRMPFPPALGDSVARDETGVEGDEICVNAGKLDA